MQCIPAWLDWLAHMLGLTTATLALVATLRHGHKHAK